MNDRSTAVVGVDAGGTATQAALAHAGAIVRTAEGPAANPSVIGVDDAADAILTTVRRVLEHERPASIVVGAAGAARPAVARSLEKLIASAYPEARVTVAGDAPIALRGAIPAGPGLVLIAGTGSVAYAEHGERRVHAGGLGYLAGDEGSAFAIGMAAVRLYGRVLDGRQRADETTDLVARALQANDRETYLDAIYGRSFEPATIAALAPPIVAFAGKGNRAATKIVQQAAQELGDLVKSVARVAELNEREPVVALAGGLLRENSLLTYLIETRIIGDLPGATIVRGGDGPLAGALRIAGALTG